MKRRHFFRTIAAIPAGQLIAQQAPAPAAPAATPAQAARPAAGRGAAATQLQITDADLTCEAAPAFFAAEQLAALRRLGALLQPPLNGSPGAAEAKAAEFLDFLIGASPADSQKLYKNGLDALNAQARKQFRKAFAELDDTQADAVVRPLLTPIPWAEDLPEDPAKRFVARAHRDLRTATQNSREWAVAGASSGRRGGRGGGFGGGGGGGSYLNPIDPIYKG
jgi:hypothetical protein